MRLLIAREIHDDLGGTLIALKMDLYWLTRARSADKATLPLTAILPLQNETAEASL